MPPRATPRTPDAPASDARDDDDARERRPGGRRRPRATTSETDEPGTDADDEEEPDEEEPDEEEPDEEEPDEEEPDEEEPDEEESDEADEPHESRRGSGEADDSCGHRERGRCWRTRPTAPARQRSATTPATSPTTPQTASCRRRRGQRATPRGSEDDEDDDESSEADAVGATIQTDAGWKPRSRAIRRWPAAAAPSRRSTPPSLKSSRITARRERRSRTSPRGGWTRGSARSLLRLAERHRITLSCHNLRPPAEHRPAGRPPITGSARAVDIATVDGEIVRPNSAAARKLADGADQARSIPSDPTRSVPRGRSGAPGFFSDGDHQDHIHVAFDEAIGRNWAARRTRRGSSARYARDQVRP